MNMSMLFSEQIKNKLAEEIKSTTNSLQIITAYCKNSAMKFMEDNVQFCIPNKKLMVRFLFDDITSGATDLSVYEFCKATSWNMYIRFDLHAKTFIFDKHRCILGSANVTSKGLGIANNANYELAAFSEISDDEIKKIDALFESAILMTDDIYSKMKACINSNDEIGQSEKHNWTDDILELFTPDTSILFTYEFPTSSIYENTEESLDFLGIPKESDPSEIKSAFIHSKPFLWLTNVLKSMPNKEIYFGELSAKLHDALINDPKPYRKEVKDLLQNLLKWIEQLEVSTIKIDRPNYSQRIRLL